MKKRFKSITDSVVASIIFALLGSMAGWVTNDALRPKFSIVSALFSSESLDKMVHYGATFKGRYSSQGERAYLWIFVAHINDPNVYHPYKVSLQNGNLFLGQAYFGVSEETDIGEKFIVHLVQSSDGFNENINSYISSSSANHKYPGLAGINDKIRILDTVNVVRK